MSAETVHSLTERVVSLYSPSSSHPSSSHPPSSHPPSSRPSSHRRPYSVDTRDQGLEIKHGILPDYSLRVRGRLHTVIFQPDSQMSVLHHTGGCGVYHRTSLQREVEASDMSNVQRLLHAPQHNVYVGICKHHIKLLNTSFECFFESERTTRIVSAVFNSCSGEVLTSGPGNITTWMFRQGAKVITHSQVITDGLLPGDEVDHLHLEDVPGKAQRCFAAFECGIKVFLLSSGKQLVDLPSLHSRPVTSLLFFRPLRLLITAAKDGAIKVWDSSWQLCCTFVGHCGAVTSLVPYPCGPTILSGSLDATIRVWNLKTQSQVEMLDHILPVEGLHAQPGVFHLLSHSGRQAKAWRVQQLYTPSTLTGSTVSCLTGTTHPKVPLRLLASCTDSAVRLVAPASGHVITTALLPVGRQIISTVYFAFQDLLYTLDHEGAITMFSTRAKNPSAKMATWSTTEDIGHYTCLALYEMAMDEEDIEELLSQDKWLGVTLEAMRRSRLGQRTKDPLEREREGYSMLLAGTSHGYLALLDHNTGDIKFSTQAHQGPVSLISCNAKKNQVVSASTDNLVHVWRLYPHAEEALSLMMSFPAASVPSLMVATPERLCMACNNHQLNTYCIDMYNLSEQTSFTGQSEHSHTDTITTLDAAPKLKLFTSCGQDATIRIWTENNHPLRILHLDSAPEGLAFSSQQGDLTIALHHHLHTITNTTYFTEALHKLLVSIQFSEVEEEEEEEGGQGFTTDLATLPLEDRQRLELVDDTIQQDAYHGALSEEEMEWLEQAAVEKTRALSLLQSRDGELRGIRDGKITSNKKRTGLKGHEKEAAWQELLCLLRPQPPGGRTKFVVPEEDDFDPDTYNIVQEKLEPYSPYTPGPCYKFFPPLATFDPPYPIAPDGYLPNSVTLQQLRKSKADQELAEQWKPPTISDQQRKLMEEMEEEVEEEEREEEEEKDSDLMARLQAALTAESPKPTPSPSPPPTPPPEPPPRRKIIPHKPIEKLIAPKAPPKPPIPPRSPTPPPPKSPTPPPTPPPPPTPLPEYIAQFIGQSWFDKLFPNANSKTFPRPWTVTRFVYSLLNCFTKAIDSYTSGDVCSAILTLCQQHSPTNKEDIHKTVLAQLLSVPASPTQSLPEQYFITRAIKLLLRLAIDIPLNAQLVAALMAYSVEGASELQQLIVGQLAMRGVEDVHGYFPREISKMVTEGLQPSTLLSRCQEWLDSWAEQMLQSREPRLRKPAPPAKKVLKGSSTVLRGKKTSTSKHKQVTFGDSSSALPPYNPIEVINYFVTVEHENELARQRVVTPPPPPPPEPEDELPHNTVIALPKINKPRSLARLGETHCSCCHPERETPFALVHRLPPLYNTPDSRDPTKLWSTFTHCITLAIKPQNINPFLSEEEKLEEELTTEQHKPSITSIMKYFVPDRSYVRTS